MHPEPQNVDLFTFDYEYMQQLALRHQHTYALGNPFPHLVIDNFLPTSVADKFLDLFPTVDSSVFVNRSNEHQPGKFGTVFGYNLSKAPPFIQHVLAMLQSYVMTEFLCTLTGIDKIVTDNGFSGGGLH